MGRLKIGVIGIPIILEKNKGLIKESFMPKMTGGLRAEIINFILMNCKENGINVDIRDLKELFDASNYSCLKKE